MLRHSSITSISRIWTFTLRRARSCIIYIYIYKGFNESVRSVSRLDTLICVLKSLGRNGFAFEFHLLLASTST